MSKPNTTDQQLGMQIVSRDKLCAACQLHTWALGWLSVTCVRVPLHLRRTTLMTWCRVSLQCTPHPTPPRRLPSTTPNPSPTPLLPPTHHPTMRQCVTSRRAGGEKRVFKEIKMDNSVWSTVSMWGLTAEGLYKAEFDQSEILKITSITKKWKNNHSNFQFYIVCNQSKCIRLFYGI